MNHQNRILVTFALIGIRRILSLQDPPIAQFIEANMVPKFLEFLSWDSEPKIQFEAAWSLTNVGVGNYDQVMTLVSKGAIDAFTRLLGSPHVEIIEQAVWGLGNLAGESPKIRDLVIKAGAVHPIADLLDRAVDSASDGFIKNLSWTLSNLCRGRPVPDARQIERAIPTLCQVLLKKESADIITDVCWAMSYLCDTRDPKTLAYIMETNTLPRLVSLIGHSHIAIVVSCLRAIGNILTGEQTSV